MPCCSICKEKLERNQIAVLCIICNEVQHADCLQNVTQEEKAKIIKSKQQSITCYSCKKQKFQKLSTANDEPQILSNETKNKLSIEKFSLCTTEDKLTTLFELNLQIIKILKKKDSEINLLKENNIKLINRIEKLEYHLNHNKQKERDNCIEIIGVDEKVFEKNDVMQIATKIIDATDENIHQNQIKKCYVKEIKCKNQNTSKKII